MPTPVRRPRPCEACRGRHLKCDGDRNNDKPCSNCRKFDLNCVRATKKFRFKATSKPKRTPGFSAEQTWLQTPSRQLSFLDETSNIAKASSQNDGTRRVQATSEDPPHNSPISFVDPQLEDTQILSSPPLTSPIVSEDYPRNEHLHIETTHYHSSVSTIPSADGSDEHLLNNLSPLAVLGSQNSPSITNTLDDSAMSLNIGLQEACLIRHFSEDLAHAFDTTDRDSHYTLTVPQRAMHSPVLLYAICTASARHLASIWRRRHPSPIIYFRGVCLPELNDETAIHYHNICLQQLMTFSNTPASEFNAIERADALAATTILRFYEQLDTSLTGLDSEAYQSVVHTVMCNHHIEALFSLESIDRAHRDENGFPNTAEGLRASACLIALRQEIWSVLLYRRPFRLPISSNLDYAQLGPADDYRWTNRIILWCADVLCYCFGPDTATTLATSSSNLAFERWDAMKAFEQSWTANQPSCFRPLHYAAPQPSRGAHFPVIWHMNDCQVQGAQHLELGRMLLAVYNPRRQRVGIGSSAMNHAIEEQLRSSILRLCGLAMSNKKFQAGMTTAAVGISIGGEYFRERDEQDAIIGFLDELEEEHAWPTRTVVRALQDAWSLQRGQGGPSMPRGPASV